MRKFLSLCLLLLLTNNGQNLYLAEKVEIHGYYGLLCLLQAAKSVYSFESCSEEEWAERWNLEMEEGS